MITVSCLAIQLFEPMCDEGLALILTSSFWLLLLFVLFVYHIYGDNIYAIIPDMHFALLYIVPLLASVFY